MNAQNKSQSETTNALEVFTFNYSESNNPVRTLLVNGEVFFVGSDVANTLGYKNSRKALSDHCRYVTKRSIPHPQNPEKTLQVLTIPEGDVFRLIINSHLPSAQNFESWVMDELLPTIRKKGYYGMVTKRNDNYVDLRNCLYDKKEFMGKTIRVIEYDNEQWFSLNDLHSAVGATTTSYQAAKVLNRVKTLARKFWIAGNTNPAWFCNQLGSQLILAGSKKVKEAMQLTFKFDA